LVRALLEDQHADLARLPLVEVASGWDNCLFRLGEDLAVRLPRRAIAAPLIKHEQRWLPELAARLPLPVPVPVRVGRPPVAIRGLGAWSRGFQVIPLHTAPFVTHVLLPLHWPPSSRHCIDRLRPMLHVTVYEGHRSPAEHIACALVFGP